MSSSDSFTNLETKIFSWTEFVYLFLCTDNVDNNIQRLQIRSVKILVKPSDEQVISLLHFKGFPSLHWTVTMYQIYQ